MDKNFSKHIPILLICFCTLMVELQAESAINIKEKSGNQTQYSLQEIKKITFSSGNIVINKLTGVTESFSLSDIRHLNFMENLSIDESLVILTKTSLFPNPAGCVVNLRFPIPTSGDIQIISLDGRILYYQSIQDKSPEIQINVSNMKSGLYICRINNGIETESVKFNKL